jgi:murein L,D-transpeptidase YafK
MGKASAAVILLAAAVAGVFMLRTRRLPSMNDFFAPPLDRTDRVAVARDQHGAAIAEKFHAVAVDYPGEIFVRWFKREAVLELWARQPERRFRLVASYPILASSGVPGPKRREGDRQVPEGFYEINRFNPKSDYHLSLGLNYPNAADLVHADPQQPGSDIFIHGKDVSIGCAPIGDEAIEELYLAARDSGQARIAVHIFPARMSGEEWARFAAEEITRRPELADFWSQLQPVYEAFERSRLVPEISVTAEGRYVLVPR